MQPPKNSSKKKQPLSSQNKKTPKKNSGKILPYIIFIFLVLLLYGKTVNYEYVYDDGIVITNNEFTQKGIRGIGDIFRYDSFYGEPNLRNENLVAGGRYRPLSIATFALEKSFFGLKPSISHFINFLLFLLSAIVIFRFINRFLFFPDDKKWYKQIGFLATVLFILHPIHTEIIANVKGRDEILSFLFAFLALSQSFQYFKNLKTYRLFLVFLLFFLSLLSKESTLPFVAIAPLTWYYFKSNIKIREIFIASIPFAVAALVYLIIRQLITSGVQSPVIPDLMNDSFLQANFSQRYATIVYCMGLYIKLLIFPHPLTYDYYPYYIALQDWTNIGVIISLIVWIVLILFAVKQIKQKSIFSYSVLFILLSLSIVSNVFFSIGVFMSERFLYLPSFAYCLVIAWLTTKYIPLKFKNSKIFYIVIIVLMIFYAGKTFTRVSAWKSNLTLFETDVKTSANSAKSNFDYAYILSGQADTIKDVNLKNSLYEKSMLYLRKAFTIYPEYISALRVYGDIHFKRFSNPDTAIMYYEKTEAILPGRKTIYNTLGTLYGQYKSNYDTALYFFNKHINLFGGDADVYKKMAICYIFKKDTASALQYAQKALEIDPNNIDCQAILKLKEKN